MQIGSEHEKNTEWKLHISQTHLILKRVMHATKQTNPKECYGYCNNKHAEVLLPYQK